MTTDSRTNEPTPEQVEAAAKAIADCHNPGMFEKYPENWRVEARAALEASNAVVTKEAHDVGMDAVDWDMVRDGVGDPQEAASIAVRAALVAAQGAAPQAGAYDHCCNHPKCPGGSLCCCISEQRQRDCWNQWREEVAGDTKQAFRDAYSAGRNDPAPWAAAPVLPSSPESPAQAFADWHERWWRNEPNTIQKANAQAAFFAGWDARGTASVLPSSDVDEDALAEVIARSRGFGNGWEQIPPLTREAYREVARAVAQWLKGQGNAARE